MRPQGAVDSVAAIKNLVISDPQTNTSYRLSDIATVSRGLAEPPTRLLFRDGQPAIGIGISNVPGGNVVEMGDAVKARIQTLTADRRIGIDITAISDQSSSVKASVSDFVMNVALALAIVVARCWCSWACGPVFSRGASC